MDYFYGIKNLYNEKLDILGEPAHTHWIGHLPAEEEIKRITELGYSFDDFREYPTYEDYLIGIEKVKKGEW